MDYLTKQKYDELVAELDHLKKVRRKEIAESLEYAKSLGDLSENAEYHEARDTQATIEDRIVHIESILKSAKIVSAHKSDSVEVGSVVSLKKEGSKDEKEYTIVGAEEADIQSGKLSVLSPLGSSVMGKKKGETFSSNTPSGAVSYKVIGIK
jgi:transcription elongation factor GreA